MNAKVERKERSHGAILDAAAGLVRKSGIAGARVAEVMKGAGLTVGGFYAHFNSKEDLVDEALRRTAAENRARLFARIEDKPPDKRAEVILKRYLSPAHRDESSAGCPFPAVVGEIATTAPEHRAVLAEQIVQLASEMETHLPVSRRWSKRQLALALVALMLGGLSLSRALRRTALSDEVLKACRALGIAALDHVRTEGRHERA